MATYLEAATGLIKEKLCAVVNDVDAAIALGKRVAGVDLSPINWLAPLAALGCNNEPPAIPPIQLNGGQCPGVNYYCLGQAEYYIASTPPSTFTAPAANQGTVVPGPLTRSQGVDGNVIYDQIRGANGGLALQASITLSYPGNTAKLKNIQIIRQDGQPDNCGTQGGVQPPPSGYNQFNGNITYVNNNGDTVTNNYNLAFGLAVFAPVFYIPFKLQLPGIELNGKVDITGNVSFEPQISFQPTLNIGANNPGNPTGNPKDEPEPEPEKYTIVGVLVTVTNLNDVQVTEIAQNETTPDIYAPALGYVNFLVNLGGGVIGYTADTAVKNVRHYIPCPEPRGALQVTGTPKPGVTWTLTPVFSDETANGALQVAP